MQSLIIIYRLLEVCSHFYLFKLILLKKKLFMIDSYKFNYSFINEGMSWVRNFVQIRLKTYHGRTLCLIQKL